MTDEVLKNKPDALFVTNMDMTLGSMMLLKEKNIYIPGDLAFIGFDDPEWAALMNPALTVVSQPTKTLASIAADLLVKRINGTDIKEKHLVHTLSTSLIVRDSTSKNLILEKDKPELLND